MKGSTFHLGALQRLPRGTSEKLRPEGGIGEGHGSGNDVADRGTGKSPEVKENLKRTGASEKVRMAPRGGVRCGGWGEQDTWQGQRD